METGRKRGIGRFVTDPYRDNPPDQYCLVLVVGFGLGPFSQMSSSEVMSLSNNDDSRIWQEKMTRGMFMYCLGGASLAALAAPPRPTLCASCVGVCLDRVR